MKIQPIEIWKDGVTQVVNELNVFGTYDNFKTSATFCYQLLSVPEGEDLGVSSGVSVVSGNIEISGDAYQAWGDTGDTNHEAYTYAAEKLGLTLV